MSGPGADSKSAPPQNRNRIGVLATIPSYGLVGICLEALESANEVDLLGRDFFNQCFPLESGPPAKLLLRRLEWLEVVQNPDGKRDE